MCDPSDHYALLNIAKDAYCDAFYRKFRSNPRIKHTQVGNKAYKQIVQLCTRHEVDVQDYIDTCFNFIEKERRYVTPNMFTTPEFLSRYIEQKLKEPKADNTIRYESQVTILAKIRAVNPETYPTDLSALLDSNTPFAAWFRILYLDKIHNTLFEYYGELAWQELQSDKALRIYLRSIKPEQLAALEARIAYFGDT